MSGLPTLVIGVGGTGLKVLQRVKERLLETYYGEIPANVALLELDTDVQKPDDHFCDIRLTTQDEQRGAYVRQREMVLITSEPNYNMNDVFREARQRVPRWEWLCTEELDRRLNESQRNIVQGAGAYRPVGRVAHFLNYHTQQNILGILTNAINQINQQAINLDPNDALTESKAKRNIFIVGSMSGGTGAGMLIDIAATLRNLKEQNPDIFKSITLQGIIALPRFFIETDRQNEGLREVNNYAGLREVDRFMLGHTPTTPYTMMTGDGSALRLGSQLFDQCYLIDAKDLNGNRPSRRADESALISIVDMIVAHTDFRMGLELNKSIANYASNYRNITVAGGQLAFNYQPPRLYSSFRTQTIIFPREDVIVALSLRFLVDILDTELVSKEVPSIPTPIDEFINSLAAEPDKRGKKEQREEFGQGQFLKELLTVTRKGALDYSSTKPEETISWLLSDPDDTRRLEELFKDEIAAIRDFSDDKEDCKKDGDSWIERVFGTRVDPNPERIGRGWHGGEWETKINELVASRRTSMINTVNEIVTKLLQQRDDDRLLPNRLRYAIAVLEGLKAEVTKFLKIIDDTFKNQDSELTTLRESWQKAESNLGQGFWNRPIKKYKDALQKLAQNERDRMVYKLAKDLANELGGVPPEQGNSSVLDAALRVLQDLYDRLRQSRDLIDQASIRHQQMRQAKYAISTRVYITDPGIGGNAKDIEEELYSRYKKVLFDRILRRNRGDEEGLGGGGYAMEWKRDDSSTFGYQLTTSEQEIRLVPNEQPKRFRLLEPVSSVTSPEIIAENWQHSSKRLWAEVIRADRKASISAYVPRIHRDVASLIERVINPTTKVFAPLNNVRSNVNQYETFFCVNETLLDQGGTQYFGQLRQQWQGNRNFYVESESEVACTCLTFYHGLTIDNIQGFTEYNEYYRNTLMTTPVVHLFREEDNATYYERKMSLANRQEWSDIKRLHPEIVVCLNSRQHVRSFALALVTSLIDRDRANANQHILRIPEGNTFLLSEPQVTDAQDFIAMSDNDKHAFSLLRAFQQYMLVGKSRDDIRPQPEKINYQIVKDTAERQLLHLAPNGQRMWREWLRSTEQEIPFTHLLGSDGNDPRLRDLGIVLLMELDDWCSERH